MKAALIAPSSPISKRTAYESIHALEQLGFDVKVYPSLCSSLNGYMAGGAVERADEINNAFTDDMIDIIWCARGGYSSCRLLPYIDAETVLKNSKPLIGYSDVTALHAYLNKLGVHTLHGPMPASDLIGGSDPITLKSIRLALRGIPHCINEDFPPSETIYPGSAVGRLIGGNLTVFASLIGSAFTPDTAGAVLFFEDIGEEVARIDRTLSQLQMSGIFEDAAGVVFGSFTDCANKYDPSYTIRSLIRDTFCNYGKPVMYGLPAGHCRPMLTLPLGRMCRISEGRIYVL